MISIWNELNAFRFNTAVQERVIQAGAVEPSRDSFSRSTSAGTGQPELSGTRFVQLGRDLRSCGIALEVPQSASSGPRSPGRAAN